MGSTYAELYADFREKVKSYTERIDVTPLSFMRILTQGMQDFQAKTAYMERAVEITKDTVKPYYVLPIDCLYEVMINEMNSDGTEGNTIVKQDLSQQYNNMQKNSMGYGSTPRNHDLDLRGGYNFRLNNTVRSKTYSIHNRNIVIEPSYPDKIVVYYIVDFPAFTQPDNSVDDIFNYWKDWYPIDTNFNAMFTTARLPVELARFERAYLNFAVAEYLKNRSSQNFIYSETIYNNEVQYAKETKPIRYNQGNVEYNLSPYS